MTEWIFDNENTRRITEARKEVLGEVVGVLRRSFELKTALDTGTGVGYFAQSLADLGFSTSGFDGRSENVAEARNRAPHVDFFVANAEDPALASRGKFDLVVSCGLLYHLENPMAAVRNLAALGDKALFLESMISPARGPAATLVSEHTAADQSLNTLAFIPTEVAIVAMLNAAGFNYVYRTRLPKHAQFQETRKNHRMRTIVLATRVPVNHPSLTPLNVDLTYLSWKKTWRDRLVRLPDVT